MKNRSDQRGSATDVALLVSTSALALQPISDVPNTNNAARTINFFMTRSFALRATLNLVGLATVKLQPASYAPQEKAVNFQSRRKVATAIG